VDAVARSRGTPDSNPRNGDLGLNRYRILAVLTIAQIGASVVQQGFGVLGPFLIADFGISKAAFGALFSAMVLGTAGFTALAGALADRLGERRMIALSSGFMALTLLAAAAFQDFTWLIVTMFLFGVAYSPQPSAGTRAVLQWFTRDRAFAMSFRQTGVPLGGMVGALLLPFVALHFGGYRAALVVAAVLVAIPSAIVVLVYRDPPDRPARKPGSYGGMLRGMVGLMRDPRLIGLCVSGIGLMGLQQATASFLTLTNVNVVGLSATAAAGVFAFAQGAAVFGRLFWSWISDQFLGGERYAIVASLSLMAAVGAVVVGSLRAETHGLAIPAAVLMGLSAAGWNGVFLTAISEIGGAERAGSVVGVTSTIIFGMSALTPGTFGLIAEHASLAVAWYAFATLAFLGVIPPIWLFATRKPAAQP
jgi:MFS family permease